MNLAPQTKNSVSHADPFTGSSTNETLLVSPSPEPDLLIGVIHTQTTTPGVLEVTGRGVVSVNTNTAQIQVGVEVEGATATEVQQEIARRSSAVVDTLRELGVRELQTVSISLRPRREFDRGTSQIVGFIGRNVLQFEIPTEQAGATIDAATNAGANIIQNISFVAPENELNEARLDAINLAVLDAQNQATQVFETLGLQTLGINNIQILGVSSPQPQSPLLSLDRASFAAATPILGGPQDVIANVALEIGFTSL